MISYFFSENDQVLLRLEHIFEENETNDELSQPVTVTLPDDFFATLVITNFRETSLGGNVFKEDMSRLKWTKNEDVSNLDRIKIPVKGYIILCIYIQHRSNLFTFNYRFQMKEKIMTISVKGK